MTIKEYKTLSDVHCPNCGSDFMALSIESSREMALSRISCSECAEFDYYKKTHEEGLIESFEKEYKIKITQK